MPPSASPYPHTGLESIYSTFYRWITVLSIAPDPLCYSARVNYLNGLNEAQKQAVLHTTGPLLIVAGAGAGKTKTITHRIAHLIEGGVAPWKILAVTFTNKAAGAMRGRVRSLVPQGKGTPVVSTFHSLGVRLLREFHREAGIPRGFSIWDRDDSIRALKKILEKLGQGETAPRGVLSAISREKGEGVSGAAYAEKARTFREQSVARAWDLYEQALKEEEALDFDDLLLRTLELLKSSPPTLSLLRGRFSHITIDEYQDTNRVQYEIARLLAGPSMNICVVGDTDQNIYSWRGADIAHLLSFEETFPGAATVTLEQNYRSTRTILAAANAVIAKNARRKPKTLFTENPTGEPLSFYGARNETDEAWFVATTAQHLMERGTPVAEIAVLYRENFQSRTLEEAVLASGIPYRVLGLRFFERKEVKDVLSYLRAAQNPKSRGDLVRIAAVPPRGIGKITLDGMLSGEEAGLAKGAQAKVAGFRRTIQAIRQAVDTLSAAEAVRFCIEASGIEAMLKKDVEEGQERLGDASFALGGVCGMGIERPLDHRRAPAGRADDEGDAPGKDPFEALLHDPPSFVHRTVPPRPARL